jgi:Protein kinase domain
VAATAEQERTRVDGGRNVPLRDGQTVGSDDGCRWRVIRHLADGGFSSVYEVRPASNATSDRHGEQTRALKCLWGTPAEVTAVGSEAAKMASVSGHENVLGLVTSFRFELADQPYKHHVGLVLERADEDLPGFGQRVQTSESAWAAVFEQVAAGLEHIHARRMVHGDIKPTNVLRVGPRFTVADFGVAAPLESTRSAGIGWARTIAFWPPESASQGVLDADGVRRPPVDGWRASQRGDVWALAVSMHRVLTGRHITPGSTPEQQYELVCLGRYALDDRLSEGWRRLLLDCLAHDPAERVVSTAAELRRRLAELALPDDYAGVAWTDAAPRVVAVLNVGREQQLLLTMTQEGGRVAGSLLTGGLLVSATRHLAEVVVPSLAQQVRDSQRALVRLASAPAAMTQPRDDDGTQTIVVEAAELEHTRELSIAVADVTRQRDRIALDRDRLARHRDELAEERDRLRRDYANLTRRLDRLEHDQRQRTQPQPPVAVPAVPGVPTHPPRAAMPPAMPRAIPRTRRRVRRAAWHLIVVCLLLALLALFGSIAYTSLTGHSAIDLLNALLARASRLIHGRQ